MHFRPGYQRSQQRNRQMRADVDMLTREATATFEALQPPPEDATIRKELMTRLTNLVSEATADAKLYPFGSSVSGLASRGADLDLTLMPQDGDDEEMDKERQGELVERIAEVMEASGQMEEVHARPKARVPIVALKDKATGLKCDICMCNKLALINSRLLRSYMQLDPRARQLAFIIKHWAKCRAVNNPYHGSPSSYAWVLCVIHYLQTCNPPVLPVLQQLYGPTIEDAKREYRKATIVKTHDGREFDCGYCTDVQAIHDSLTQMRPLNLMPIGELLIGFFRRYAREFDFVKAVACVRTGTYMSKADKGWDKKDAGFRGDRHLFCMEVRECGETTRDATPSHPPKSLTLCVPLPSRFLAGPLRALPRLGPRHGPRHSPRRALRDRPRGRPTLRAARQLCEADPKV